MSTHPTDTQVPKWKGTEEYMLVDAIAPTDKMQDPVFVDMACSLLRRKKEEAIKADRAYLAGEVRNILKVENYIQYNEGYNDAIEDVLTIITGKE